MKTIAEIKKEFEKLNYNKENISCDSCNYCHYCNYSNYCDYCNYCNNCEYCNNCVICNYCHFCDYCNNCEYCNYCDYCNYCNYCDNVVNGLYCKNLKLKDKDSEKYWLLNKEITKEEFEKYKEELEK